MPSIRRFASSVGRPSVCGVVANGDSSVLVPCVSPSQSSSRSSSGSSSEIILRLRGLVSSQVPAVGCRARPTSNDVIDEGRIQFGSISSGMAVSARTDRFIRFGCCGAVPRPKEERSSSLPGALSLSLSLRRTSSVGESGWYPCISLTLVGTHGLVTTSVASPVPSDDLGRPCTSPSVGLAVSVGIKYDISGVIGALSAPSEGSCGDVGAPVNLEIGVGLGAELVPYDSDSLWRGKQCAACDPCDDVGTGGSGVLCFSGDRCHGCRSKDVGGARVCSLGSQEALSPRIDASVARPVPIKEENVVSDSCTTGGEVVCSLSAFPLFHPEGYSDNVYRIVLCHSDSPRDASCPSPAIEAHGGGSGQLSSPSGANDSFPLLPGPPSVDVGSGGPVWIDDHGINGVVDYSIDVHVGVDTTDGTKRGIAVRGRDVVVADVVRGGLIDHWNRKTRGIV